MDETTGSHDLNARIIDGIDSSCRVVVDTSGPALKETLEAGIFLIKPNIRELGQLAGRSVEGDEEIEAESRRLIEAGKVEVILPSLGSAGAMLVTPDHSEAIRAPTVNIRSRIGAGDSAVAGMVIALARGESIARAARYGIAAGSAAVMCEGSGLCHLKTTAELFEKMNSAPR